MESVEQLKISGKFIMSIQNMLIEVAGREKIMVSGREVTAFKLIGHFQGVELLMWVDEEGNKLKEESPLLGFTLISESREEAVRFLIVQSKDPMIINLAREIIRKEKNSLAVAKLLHNWVFKNIEKTPSITIPWKIPC